jgi:hypothetical protein
MRAVLAFAVSTLLIIVSAGWALTLVFTSSADRSAIVTSGWIALVVQLIGFAIVRLTLRHNVIAGWGLGAILRFAVLGVYAFLLVGALGLSPTAAVVSLAVFFFLSTLVEPLLLNL